MKIVVNRVGYDTGQISLKKAQETIGREIFWQVPNDYRMMVEVRNNGVPLIEQAPKAAITQSIGQLADVLCGKHDEGMPHGEQQSSQLAQPLAEPVSSRRPSWSSRIARHPARVPPRLFSHDRHNRADRSADPVRLHPRSPLCARPCAG